MKRPAPLLLPLYIMVCLLCMADGPPLSAQTEAQPVVTEAAPVNYQIEAQLFPDEKKLLGYETITWLNTSTRDVDTLRFHLYYNAFKSENTTFLSEAGFNNQSQENLSQLSFGEIKIKEIRVLEGEELTSKIRYIAPEDKNPIDQTVMEVGLRNPIPANNAIVLKISYVLLIPQIFARTGQAGDYFFMGQWFPKIGVINRDGSWNCSQYHHNSEFFSNFGSYRVGITLPERFTVGATGNLTKKTKNADGTYTQIFEEHNIHDFAWAAYPKFKEIIEKIRLKGNTHETTIVLLLSHHHSRVKERYLNTLRFAMEYYADRISPYPYKKITLVDPPLAGIRSACAEYPTLISGGYIEGLPHSIKFTELITLHEFGHQYWYGIIGTDGAREAWLDEGINTFFEMEITDQLFGNDSPLIDLPLVKVRNWQRHRWRYRALPHLDRINQYAWSFITRSTYTGSVNSKAGILLRSLKNYLGENKMMDFFQYYTDRYRFGHPTSADFFHHFNLFMNEDFTWVLNQYINGTSHLDHAVKSVKSTPINTGSETYRNEVVFIRNQGYFPVELQILHENGKVVKHFWRDRNNRKRINYIDPSPIRTAIIDPDNKIPLDINYVNNRLDRKPNKVGLKKATLKLGYFFQNLLGFLFL